MKFNVGVTRCAKAIDCLLMHTFNQQKFNLVFSSDTLAISPSCFVLTDVVLNESSSQQHIKKLSRQYERLRRRPEEMSSRGKSQDKTPEREEMVACKSEWLHKCDRSHQIAPVKNICEGAGRLLRTDYFTMVFTPSAVPISATSAPRLANSPTVTTPGIPLIAFSSAIASRISVPCTSRITLPLSVTTP